MFKKNQRMDERILVCVYYGPHGEQLIRRGCSIAKMLACPLYILTVDSKPLDELDAAKSNYITKWSELAEKLGVDEFIVKDNEDRPSYKVIADVAREKGITQIVIGQSPQSRWEQISKESIVNSLLREIPFVDLHIVAVNRYLSDPESNYDRGVRAYLIKQDQDYALVFRPGKDVLYEGIFFKETGTDFNNGIFKFSTGKGTMQVEVFEDIVKDFTHVDLETDYDEDE